MSRTFSESVIEWQTLTGSLLSSISSSVERKTLKQKLELTWIGKDKRPKLEPRILLEDPGKRYHAKHRVTVGDIFDNRLALNIVGAN